MLLACSANTSIHNSRFYLLAFASARPVWIGPKQPTYRPATPRETSTEIPGTLPFSTALFCIKAETLMKIPMRANMPATNQIAGEQTLPAFFQNLPISSMSISFLSHFYGSRSMQLQLIFFMSTGQCCVRPAIPLLNALVTSQCNFYC